MLQRYLFGSRARLPQQLTLINFDDSDPTTRVPLRNDEEDDEPSVGTAEEGTKSDLDKIHGDPNTDSEDTAGPVIDSARQLLLVTMIVSA